MQVNNIVSETNRKIVQQSFQTDFENKNSEDINFNKVHEIIRQLEPLTLPFKDFKGRVIQLWKKGQHELLGAILDEKGITILPKNKVLNPCNPHEKPEELIQRLKGYPLKTWDFVFDTQRLTLTIWPHLKAAGKYDHMDIKDILTDVNQRLYRMTTLKVVQNEKGKELEKGGPLNHRHYADYRKEFKGQPVIGRDGNPLIKHNGEAPDHKNDVHEGQDSAIKLIKHMKRVMGRYNLKPEERQALEKHYAKTSKILDDSKKYTSSKSDPAKKQFQQTLQQTKLTKSYNATHPNNQVPAKSGTGGQIGGVACSMDYIQGLFDSPAALFEEEHLFCLPKLHGDQLPFSDVELRQILRELAIGIYVHSTVPFFSLHFRQETLDLFPVIHPAYENTLVGRVIGMLDYFMKGYLNGGVYSEEFIDQWYKDPQWNHKSVSALEALINFQQYCENHLEGMDKHYKTTKDFQELLKNVLPIQQLGLLPQNQQEPAILADFSGFKNSFRIIAKQNSFQKHDELFLIDSDFEVLYTIEPSPEYKEELAKYMRKHETLPSSYQYLIASYELMSQQIHDHMVKMPLCRQYFSMLGVINFFSSYFSTLKKHRKVPILTALEMATIKGCPPLFPYLPIIKNVKESLKVNPFQICNNLIKNNFKFLENYLQRLYSEVMHMGYTLLEYKDQFEYDIKGSFDDEIKRLIFYWTEKSSIELCSPSFKKFLLNDYESIQKIYSDASSEFLNKLHLEFQKLVLQVRGLTKENNIPCKYPSQELYYKVREQTVKDFLVEFLKKFEDKPRSITNELPYDKPYIVPDLEVNELEKNRKVVGGCGMQLTVQELQPSQQAADILIKNWVKLDALPAESWKKIRVGNSKGAVFKLLFEDVPAEVTDSY